MRNGKGITLIALVVTIIILIILAGISINLVLGENGIINKAKEASQRHEIEEVREKIEMAIAEIVVENTNTEFNMKSIINLLPQKLKGVTWNEGVAENTEEPYGMYGKYEFYINKDYKLIITGVDDSIVEQPEQPTPEEPEEDPIIKDKYVETGLQLYLDAKEANTIENNIWKDISGKQNNATLNGCTVEEGKVTFDGVDDWASIGEQNYGEVTLEVVFDVRELPNESSCILGNYETGGYGIELSAENKIKGAAYVNGEYKTNTKDTAIVENTKYKVTLTSNCKETKLYINGEIVNTIQVENGLIEMPNWNTIFILGANPIKDSAANYFFNGSIYLARLYDKVLDENEIKLNYNYDNNKFNINENYFKDFEYADDTYKIASVSELEAFRDEVNNGNTFEGKYIQLQTGLDLTEIASWTPIGTTTNPFKGNFDGNGYDITNLNIDNSAAIQGLFGRNEGVIQNLNIKSGTIKGTYRVGAIAGENTGNIISCSNSATIAATSYYVGGICGHNTGNVQKCYNTGSCSTNSTSLGGIVGRNDTLVKFCYNTAEISSTSHNVGGIAGIAYDGTISSCYNIGSISTTGYSTNYNSFAAGILGNAVLSTDSEINILVTDCYNTGNVTGAGSCDGGIVGYSTGTVQYSYNTGTISAKRGNSNNNAYAGGIAGISEGNPSKILYCYNIGTAICESGTNKYSGGITGYNISTGTVTNCYTLSTAISTPIGYNKGTATNATSKTMAQMKASDFITLLGSTARWQVVTNNYPKLYWEY